MTARLRLTLAFCAAFAALGAALLVISYILVDASLKSTPTDPSEWLRIALGFDGQLGSPSGVDFGNLVSTVRQDVATRTLQRLTVDYLAVFAGMLAITSLAGWWLAGRVLNPLRSITATARRVSHERLGERIALDGPADELRELADTFDEMLARLQAGLASQERFIANASHELRTPLAVIRTSVEVTLANPDASTDDLRAMGDTVRQAVDRSERLIQSLLLLARSQSGRAVPNVPVDLAEHLRAGLEAAGSLQVFLPGAEECCDARGEPHLLERAVDNLIDNAISHNTDDGWIAGTCGASAESGTVWLRIANSCAPIEPADVPGLVEPFRRLDEPRLSAGGVGLGLSIVDSIARLHGGVLRVEAPHAEQFVAELRLPAALFSSHDQGI